MIEDHDAAYRNEVAEHYALVFRDRSAGVDVYENDDAFPRAFVSPALTRGQVLPGPTHWTRATTVTDDQQLLSQASRADVPTSAPSQAPSASASITEDGSTVVKVEVEAARASVLILADTYHPNWTATVNGRPAHVGRVDSVVRGVVVPGGTSVVVFRYRSGAHDVGELVSIATGTAAAIGVGILALVRRRRRTG